MLIVPTCMPMQPTAIKIALMFTSWTSRRWPRLLDLLILPRWNWTWNTQPERRRQAPRGHWRSSFQDNLQGISFLLTIPMGSAIWMTSDSSVVKGLSSPANARSLFGLCCNSCDWSPPEPKHASIHTRTFAVYLSVWLVGFPSSSGSKIWILRCFTLALPKVEWKHQAPFESCSVLFWFFSHGQYPQRSHSLKTVSEHIPQPPDGPLTCAVDCYSLAILIGWKHTRWQAIEQLEKIGFDWMEAVPTIPSLLINNGISQNVNWYEAGMHTTRIPLWVCDPLCRHAIAHWFAKNYYIQCGL